MNTTDDATRIRDEWNQVRSALQGQSATEVQDPLGQDGQVQVALNHFKANGGGEVILVKGASPGDRRYTRFRAYGASGDDVIEKTSQLIKADGTTVFHKRKVQDNQVAVIEAPDGDDQAWLSSLA